MWRPWGRSEEMNYIANADYEEMNSRAIHLVAGQEVTSGPVDRTWPGWIWASDANGSSGYVPAEILEPLGEDRWAAMEAFDPSVLKVKRGDRLDSLRQVHGWHWCRQQKGDGEGNEGWVAGYLLKEEGAETTG